jgi:hypothetical protein
LLEKRKSHSLRRPKKKNTKEQNNQGIKTMTRTWTNDFPEVATRNLDYYSEEVFSLCNN